MSRWRQCCWLLLGLVLTAQAAADDFFVDRINLSTEDGYIQLSADIRYPLNETALEALENGVPLTFVTHIEVREIGAWIWQKDLVEIRLRSLVRYHPLSGLYELLDIESDFSQNFATREAVFDALGEIRGFPLVAVSRLESGVNYKMRLYTYLDIEALPLPLRPLAHVTPSWHLESDTWEQRLKP